MLPIISIFSLLPILLLGVSSANTKESNRELLTQEVFDRVRPHVYQIKTARAPNAPKASYGSGFVVSTEGHIITNYHVVSTCIQYEKDYKMYLIDGETSIEAKIISVDVTNDLALLKVQKKFSKFLKLANQMPQHGAKIFSIGLPQDLNMSIIEGVYNGVIDSGAYKKVHMSTPLNSGMSGGPTVNSKGEVIAVNVSILITSQNISFSVPVEFVQKLLTQNRDVLPSTVKKENIHQDIERQINQIQNSLMSSFKQSANNELKMDNWGVRRPAKILKCWSTNNNHKQGYYKSVNETCYLQRGAFLTGSVVTGSYELSYRTLKSTKLNHLQLLNVAEAQYNNSSAYYNILLNSFFDIDDLLTKYKCSEGRIVNKNSIPLIFNYCLRGYVKYKTLYNVNLKAMTLNTNKDILVTKIALTGFTLESIKIFIQEHLDSIRKL